MKRYFQLKKSLAFAIAFVAVSLVGCEKYVIESKEINPADPRSFKDEILPIFAKYNCTGCHAGSISPDLRAENAYASLKSGGLVIGTPPESAKLYKKFSPTHSGITMLDEEKQYILYWITQGAQDN
jgi:hypothetical protein